MKPVSKTAGRVFRTLVIGMVCTTSLMSPSMAQTLTRLPAEAPTVEAAVMPGFSAGEWRERVQLVWDSSEKRLVRRNYRIWDPLAALKYELFWIADHAKVDRDGPINGSGRLVWRKPGAPSYDKDASIAQYVGEMFDGRASGNGEYLHRSGASYRGSWRGGSMEGRGRMLLPNGDQYIGFFKAGRRDGSGIYIDRTGTIYDGGFSGGLKDGPGRIGLQNGLTYTALWRADQEITGTRKSQPLANKAGFELAQYQNYEDIQIGIAVDRRAVIDATSGQAPLPYVSEASAEGLKVFPDNKRILDVWRGNTDIQITEEEQMWWPPSFLGSIDQYKPVPMIVDLENKSDDTLRIVGGYLDIKRSKSDMEPAVQIVGPGLDCSSYNVYTAGFDIQNFGWSDISNVKVSGGIYNTTNTLIGNPVSMTVETVTESAAVDMSEHYRLPAREELPPITCDVYDPEACLQTARKSPKFKDYADALHVAGAYLAVPFKGMISYDWQSVDNKVHRKQAPFSINLLVGYVVGVAECGEGGREEVRFRDPFKLKADAENYRIPIRLNDDIPAGVTARWRLQFDAEMTSVHDFQVVLQLADGRDVATRSINLSYFKPRPHKNPDYENEDTAINGQDDN